MDLLPLIETYLRHLAQDRHRAATTVAGARDELTLLVKRGIALEPAQLSAHLTWLPDGQPLAPSTRNRRLAILRGFVRFLRDRNVLVDDPLAGVRRAKLVRRVHEALTAAQLEAIVIALLARPPSRTRTRDATLLLLLYYTGLRLTEVCRLDVNQVDLDAGVLRRAVRKGGDVTDVVLHPCLAAQLAAWLAARGPVDGSALFPRGNSDRLSTRSIQLRVRRMGRDAGLTAPLHPHALRHAHATGLLRVGVATAIIQQSMNHHALATTELYLHGDLAMVRAAVGLLPALPLVGAPSTIPTAGAS